MFCKKCGSNINEGARFCPNCGEPVGFANNAGGENIINDTPVTNDINAGNAGTGQNQVIPPVSALWDMYDQNGQPTGGQSAGGQYAGGQPTGQSAGGQYAGGQPAGQSAGGQHAGGQPAGQSAGGQYAGGQATGTFAGGQYAGTQSTGSFTGGQSFNTQSADRKPNGLKQFLAGHKALLIAGAVVIAAAVLVLANMATVGNFLRRTFSSPENYYHYVEKKTVDEFSSNAGEMYGKYFLENLSVSDQSVSAEIGMSLGEGGQTLMTLVGLTGVDVSWFKSASLKVDTAVKKDAVSMGLGVVLNGVSIVTGNAVVDLDGEAVYLQVPEINEQYIGIEVPDVGSDDMEEVWAMYEMLERVCPSQEEAEKLLNRYLMIAVENMDDVSKEKGVLKAEGIEQNCTVLSVTMDANTVKNMAIEILRQMEDDKDIEKIIKNAMGEKEFVEALDLDDTSPEEAYEEFRDWIDMALEDLEDLDESDDGDALRMDVYVNRKGKIAGRTIKVEDTKINMLMPEKGNQFGYELSYKDTYYDESWKLTGTGKRSGDKIDGEFVLAYNKAPIVNLEVQGLNTEDMKKGMPNGKVVLGLSEKYIDEFLGEEFAPGMSILEGAELSMDLKSDRTSGSCNMGVSLRDKNILEIAMSYKKEKGYKGADPAKNAVMLEDEEDLLKWGKNLNLGGLSESLKKADVPSQITDSLDLLDGVDMETLFEMLYYYY